MGHPRPTQPRGCRCYGPLAWGSMGSPTPGTPKVSPGATCSLCAHVCAPPPCDRHGTAQTGVWFLRACARRQLLPGLPRPGGLSGASPSQDSPAPDRGRGEGGARRGHVSRRGGGEGGVYSPGPFHLQSKPLSPLTPRPDQVRNEQEPLALLRPPWNSPSGGLLHLPPISTFGM